MARLWITGFNPFKSQAVAKGSWECVLGQSDEWSLIPKFGVASSSGPNAHAIVGLRSGLVSKMISAGANESGQLGIGSVSSTAPSLGVSDLDLDIVKLQTGNQASYLLTSDKKLFAFGSNQRGQLGAKSPEYSSAEYPEQRCIASPVRVAAEHKIVDVATGFEHALALTSRGKILGTGCNTDGQLDGTLEDVLRFAELSFPSDIEAQEIASIHAGADTSALITKNGELYTWGNSEYGQALHGRKIDQIETPTRVPHSQKITDYLCGGSFGIIRDDQNQHFIAGYGAIASSSLENLELTRLPLDFDRVVTGLGYAVGVKDDTLYIWGVDRAQRRHLTEPTRVPLNSADTSLTFEGQIGQVSCGFNWVMVEEIL